MKPGSPAEDVAVDRGWRARPRPAGFGRRGVVARPGPLLAVKRRRRRLTWMQALLLVGSVTTSVVLLGGVLVHWTDPDRFPDVGTGWWWAITTVTTVGYGDHVPVSVGGRVLGAALMLVGIACFAFLTAVAASAIVVGEVGAEEQLIEREESTILAEIRQLNARLGRLEELLDHRDGPRQGPAPVHPGDPSAPRREPQSVNGRAAGQPRGAPDG
jgi:voltage-gated potassium channel